jgi:hypothetical protein
MMFSWADEHWNFFDNDLREKLYSESFLNRYSIMSNEVLI